ncbi:MAG: ABC transporter ATP-binding protein, partial [Umezawaea sp.]
DPALLVLDEPTVGLDVAARRSFWSTVAARCARGVGVLVTTHLIEESAGVADRVVVVDKGRVLASGTPDELVAVLPDRTIVATSSLDDSVLAGMPGVLSMSRDGRWVRLRTREPEAVLRVLLVVDPGLGDLRVEQAGLEEAVVSIGAAA